MQKNTDQLQNAVCMLSIEVSELKKLLIANQESRPGKDDEFLTISQAAILLNLTVPTMYGKVSRGELPVMKRGKRLYFSREQLTNYIKDGKKKSSAEIDAEANAYLSNKKSAAL